LSPPDVTEAEREALVAALQTGYVAPVGPTLRAFEAAVEGFFGEGAHAVALSSGTAALHLALQLAGVQRGDLVLVPTFTFAATVNPALYLGAEVVFIDADGGQDWHMDFNAIADALSHFSRLGRRVRALVVVDTYGDPADTVRLGDLCQAHGVAVIQDAAEAIGARTATGEAVGLQGTMGALSFNGNKLMTTGGGGMLLSRDAGVARQARALAAQAKVAGASHQHFAVGYNYRMSNLLAGIGLAQLKRLDELLARRRENFLAYQVHLAGLEAVSLMPVGAHGRPNHWLSCLRLNQKHTRLRPTELIQALEAQGIEARPVWQPLHTQVPYAGAQYFGSDVAWRLFQEGLCLPSGSTLTNENLARVCEVIKQQLTR
jgi:dTDP-4-amino-4,6-dideoxygalactose transaminase